jgi:hypothetical protein
LCSFRGSGHTCRLIKPAGQQQSNPTAFVQLLRDSLIHQDLVTYVHGLFAKVHSVVTAASVVLNETYDQFKNLQQNQAALLQLQTNFESYKFENFTNV